MLRRYNGNLMKQIDYYIELHENVPPSDNASIYMFKYHFFFFFGNINKSLISWYKKHIIIVSYTKKFKKLFQIRILLNTFLENNHNSHTDLKKYKNTKYTNLK